MSTHRRLALIRSHLGNFDSIPKDTTLDEFRARGTPFDQREMEEIHFGPILKRFEQAIKEMETMPQFNHLRDIELSRPELREATVRQVIDLYKKFAITEEEDHLDPSAKAAICTALGMYTQSPATVFIVHAVLYLDSLQNLGTEKHKHLITRGFAYQDVGCFCMTEIGHGSNVNGLETVATYDHATREFVINTPTPTAAKWWVGGLAKNANMTILFAQLVVDNVNRGVHVFAIPIRDMNTHEVMKGCIIGDCGPKAGIDGIDNGFILFQNYRVPYDCMLDRISQISPEGKFKSNIKNNDRRFSVMLGGLIRGRMGVMYGSMLNTQNGLTTAIRYSAVRKQFGPVDKPERSLLDYQLQRYRLMPHLAKMFASSAIIRLLARIYIEKRKVMYDEPESSEGAELHAILSAGKTIVSTYGFDAIHEARAACGGHGYSKFSMLGQLTNNQDIHLTWEGDNHVLIQQTSKFILKHVQKSFKGQKIEASSLQFIKMDPSTPHEKATFKTKEDLTLQACIDLLKYRANYYVHKSIIRLQENSTLYDSVLDVWNNTQVHFLQPLAWAYGELIMAEELARTVDKAKCQHLKALYQTITKLFVLERIEKNIGVFLEEHINADQAQLIRDSVIDLCNVLAEDAVKIIDALAVPDSIHGSVLGVSDGQIYKHYMKAVESRKGVYDKAHYADYLISVKKSS